MTVGMPAWLACSAAQSFENIPPRPSSEGAVSSAACLAAARSVTTGMSCASGFVLGSRSNTPSTSLRITNRSISMSVATSAESWSLSPNFTSSTATVSFSLTMGMMSQSSSVLRVCLALR